MQVFQTLPTTYLCDVTASQELDVKFGQRHSFLARAAVLAVAIRRRLLSREDAIAARYSGCGWGDATERAIIDDVTCRPRSDY